MYCVVRAYNSALAEKMHTSVKLWHTHTYSGLKLQIRRRTLDCNDVFFEIIRFSAKKYWQSHICKGHEAKNGLLLSLAC